MTQSFKACFNFSPTTSCCSSVGDRKRGMEGLASVCSHEEHSIDELKQRLLHTIFELESARNYVTEETRKSEENIKQLVHLLQIAWQERDEARDQLQRLTKNFMPSSPTVTSTDLVPHQSGSPPVKLPKANSIVTESDSLSEIYNYHSYGSFPVDTSSDALSSQELSNMNMADLSNLGVSSQPLVQEYNGSVSASIPSSSNGVISTGIISPANNGVISTDLITSRTSNIDHALAGIDDLVKRKPLPQKGRLLQAVMEAGPLLQTLFVAGTLPRWRNPPPLQSFQIPPVSITVSDSERINQESNANLNCMAHTSLSSSHTK